MAVSPAQQALIDFIRGNFEFSVDNAPYNYRLLSRGLTRSLHYAATMPNPRAPMFHPYNPQGDTAANATAYTGIPGAIVVVRCPNECASILPQSIQAVLQANGVTTDKLSLFFVTQNMPWRNQTLLLRPHYWVHGKAEHDAAITQATFNLDTPCRMGVFSPSSDALKCDGLSDALLPRPISVNSHAYHDQYQHMTICSPNRVGSLSGLDFARTDSLYSVVIAPDGSTAVTLHWLLNLSDHADLAAISHRVTNLEELALAVFALPNSRLNAPNGPLSSLIQLFNMAVLVPAIQQQIALANVQRERDQKYLNAVASEDVPGIMAALALGANVNATALPPSGGNCSALDLAVLMNKPSVVPVLLAAGINLDYQGNQFAKTAFQLAREYQRPEIIALIEQEQLRRPGNNAITYQRDLEAIRRTLAANQRYLRGAAAGDLIEVNAALREGADVNAISPPPGGGNCSALDLAVLYNRENVVPCLLDAGINVNYAGNQFGKTALQLARDHNRTEMVRFIEARQRLAP